MAVSFGEGNSTLGDGFRYFLCSPILGEDEPILTVAYFSNGVVKNHQPPPSFMNTTAPDF